MAMGVSFDEIRLASAWVCQNAEQVMLHPDKIDALLPVLQDVNQEPWYESLPVKIEQGDLESALRFAVLFNATSFCYWQKPKWRVVYLGEELGGAFSLATCYASTIKEKPELLEPHSWPDITSEDYLALTRVSSGRAIPLASDRLTACQKIGKFLVEQHDGRVMNFVAAHDHDAVKILQSLSGSYSFDDIHRYQGKSIPFLKRAQLATADISSLYRKHTGTALRNAEHITACPDYKLPQIMRHYGLLSYAPDLAGKIDTETELASGSPAEVEIRAATVTVVEMIRDSYHERKGIFLTSNQISDQIWLLSQNDVTDIKPHHRTVTYFY